MKYKSCRYACQHCPVPATDGRRDGEHHDGCQGMGDRALAVVSQQPEIACPA
jgi:hypothetical protein